MADGSPDDRTGPKQIKELTFSAAGSGHGDTKKCSGKTFDDDRVKLAFYTEQETSDPCEKSDTGGVAANRSTAVDTTNSRKTRQVVAEEGDDRKKRCFDRYDSSESSDRSRDDSRRRRVTYQQLESLWEFLNCHNDLAVGYNKSAQAREYSKRMWMTVAESLNSQGEGATKDWKGWSNYWVDYKAKLKRRVAALRTSQTRTGGGPSDAIPLNDLEKKFLSLLGEGFGMGLPNTQVDPFPNLSAVNTDQQLEPVAGPSHVEIELMEEIIFSNEEMVQPQDPPAQTEATEEVPARQTNSVRRRRRSNRQPPLTQEAARRILVEVAKERLELHKQQLELQKQEVELHKQELELHKQDFKVWQDMLITQQSIATVLSGVAVLSPTESGGCSGSDITEPGSPCSPESSCSTAEEGTGAGARMPPWASDPAPPPPAPRRLAAQPAPVRRSQPPIHRRITEYFNHKMKPQNGLKRDCNATNNEDTKRKCLPKNGVTHDLEKYISYLSQTLSPKVLMDVGKQAETIAKKQANPTFNGVVDCMKPTDLSKMTPSSNVNGMMEFGRSKEGKEKSLTTMNGFVELRQGAESFGKEKLSNGFLNGLVDGKKHRQNLDSKMTPDPSANCTVNSSTPTGAAKRKIGIPMSTEFNGVRIAPATSASHSPRKSTPFRSDTRVNGVVSSTTKLDSRMNGVTCGSNNLSLNSKSSTTKKETAKKNTQAPKRTNRKSSACIANSKNLTWSKANNLKQLQQQNCVNSNQRSPAKTVPGEANTAPNINIPNGIRQVSMTVNGSLGNLNVPVKNLQNCHQINHIPQPCNGTVSSSNLTSFVAVPPNVMLTTLRIPQNGLPAQTLTQQNNMAAFNRPNVNVSSPSKLNGQFVFPLVQNINGTVVQIPNLMTKMPNFVLPQTPQLTPSRQDHLQNHLQNQQAAQILINGTLLKLANTMTSAYPNVNKSAPVTSQSISMMNKSVPGMPSVGMTVQPNPNYTVNLSHPMLMPQPGFIVTSVPNINVKETWSYTNTNTPSSSQTSCSNPIVHHPAPILANFTSQALHTSSIPIAPVKPPDNPIQGTEPPSSTVKDELSEVTISKCDIPWLSKTVNNNIVPLDSNKISSRPFAHVSLSEKIDELAIENVTKSKIDDDEDDSNFSRKNSTDEHIRKIEEVARREETIFTQITVLKDVSSNVQNTVIEANYSSATTESSESGIGTDKSIDSPSDSQTSKECDDDSSLSLSVSICSVDVQSQKSPILKQPKTLRFPPRNPVKTESNKRTSSTDTTSTITLCRWENCQREFESDTDLLEHLQVVHVESQAGRENYVCLWQQCKVRGKPSCSRLWLERHTQSHGGNKPFKCIVDGCDRRFSTQILLERHVNNHFNEVSPNANGSKKAADSAAKLIRRNGKKLRYRRQPWSARMFDFFDAGTMEGLSWRLSRSTRWRLGGGCPLREPPGRHTLTLHAALTATRHDVASGRTEHLVTYYPPHVIEDEWVPEKEVKLIKRVEIAELPVHTKTLLYDQFCASYKHSTVVKTARPSSSKMLNNLIAKQKGECRSECGSAPLIIREEEKKPEVSGAKKRKMGRRYGGDCFWPSGR